MNTRREFLKQTGILLAALPVLPAKSQRLEWGDKDAFLSAANIKHSPSSMVLIHPFLFCESRWSGKREVVWLEWFPESVTDKDIERIAETRDEELPKEQCVEFWHSLPVIEFEVGVTTRAAKIVTLPILQRQLNQPIDLSELVLHRVRYDGGRFVGLGFKPNA